MGIFDWLGPLGTGGKARGWGDLPAQIAVTTGTKRAPDFVPTDANGTVAILNRLVQVPAPFDGASRRGDGNSAVFACLQLIATALTEPPFRVYRVTPDERVEMPPSPLSELLARPNPSMTLRTLLGYASDCLHVDGNAYWRKLRAGDPETGNVVELWPISPTRVEVVTRPGSSDFISFYRYSSGSSRPEEISPTNMVHLRYGLDDRDHRLGSSPLRRLFSEISSDQQATRYADRLLSNLAVNGLSLEFDGQTAPISQAQADELKARIQSAYGGDNVGAVSVLSPGAKLVAHGFSPEQMDLRVLHQVPEERIAAALGVPAAVVGLGAGLEHSIYNNVRQAEEHFTERKLSPLWDALGDALTLQLVPDFTTDRTVRIEADTSDVRALADDQNQLAVRLKTLVEAGILTEDEARSEIGYEPKPAPASLPRALPTAASRRGLRALRPEHKAVDDVVGELGDARDEALPAWQRELIAFLAAQGRRAVRRLEAGADTADEIVTDGETVLLTETLEPLQLAALADVSRIVAAELAVAFGLDDPATRAYLLSAGVQIGGITETTRAAVRAALLEGQQAGEGIPQLAARLRALPAFDAPRARVVARTELGRSQNLAALSSYRASGVVVGVRVHDGDADAECAAMNGRAFALDQAPPPLQHPSCTRALAPITDAGDLTRSA